MGAPVSILLIVAGAVGLAGIVLLVMGVRGRPPGGAGRWCPRCFYVMDGLTASECPECGHVARSEGELHRRRRGKWAVRLGVLLVLAGAAGVLHDRGLLRAWYEAVRPRWETTQVVETSGYKIVLLKDRDPQGFLKAVEVRKDGQTVLRMEGYAFEIGYATQKGVTVGVGTPITGGQQAEVIITEFSGGAHCCWTHYVFELGADFRPVARLEGGGRFEDLTGDGRLSFITGDRTWDYWNTSHAESIIPRVVLTPVAGHYAMDLERMRTSAPAWEELARRAEQLRGEGAPDVEGHFKPGPATWGVMLDLLYGGHAQLAWRFLEEVWPRGDEKGREAFRAEFMQQLSTSPYAGELRALNAGK